MNYEKTRELSYLLIKSKHFCFLFACKKRPAEVSSYNQYRVHSKIILAEIKETMEAVGCTPGVFRNEIALTLAVVSNSDECKCVVIGSLSMLESPLALLLRDVSQCYFCYSRGLIEARRRDVTLPKHGPSTAQSGDDELHHRV